MEIANKSTWKEKMVNTLGKIKEDLAESKKINTLVEDWKDIMYEIGMHTHSFNTCTLLNIKKEPYGYHCNIYATKGLRLDDLEKAKPFIETGIGCIFIYYIEKKGAKIAEAKFITEGFGGEEAKFIPPKTTPFELYIGNSVEGEPVVISAKEVSHFLLSGSNGSGKSRLLDIMITTLIHNCDEKELELYLAQIAKNDLVVYEDARCCRAFCETLNEVEIMLTHILVKMDERTKLIKPMRKDFLGSDIYNYNKLHPLNPMSVCWVIFDEIASIMEKTGNNKKVSQQKDRIITMIEEISRVGRALGIFLGVCLQRCTANMLSPLVKSQTNLRISFAQNNMKSSEVATDDPNIAIGLDDRVAVYSCRARGFDFVKTPYMDDKVIEQFVKPKSQRNHRNLFTDLEKLNAKPPIEVKMITTEEENEETTLKDKGVAPLPKSARTKLDLDKLDNDKVDPTPQDKVDTAIKIIMPEVALTFDKVDPIITVSEQQKLIDNIKNIPNFVPFNPNNTTKIVIDQTKIDFSKTQKPQKTPKNDKE